MFSLPTKYTVYINEINDNNSVMIVDEFDESDAKYIFENYNCKKLLVTENKKIVKEITKNQFEVYWIDKLCNKIHQEFQNSSSRNYNVLEDICRKNDIKVDDYLYNQGYHDYFEYKEDLKILPKKELSINEILNKIPKTIKEYLDYPIHLIKRESKKENTSCDSQDDLVYADNEICYYDCHDGDYVYIDTQEAMGFKEETNHSYLKNQVLYVNGLSENLLQADNNKSLYNEICIKYNLYDCIKENCYIDENFKKDIEDIQKIKDFNILSNCVDYQVLKENLSKEKLEQLEKGLESYEYYRNMYYVDGNIIEEYTSKYGNEHLINWYEGILTTDSLIEMLNNNVEKEI